MNIFLTSPDPFLCAIALDNKRLSKMVLETAQLLSTALHALQIPDLPDDVYRPTHFNHPCSLFARQSWGNFAWLLEHGLALSREFERRFNHVHASEAVIVRCWLLLSRAKRKKLGLTVGWRQDLIFSFNCSGFSTGDVFRDYQLCLIRKWEKDKVTPKWPRRSSPTFWAERLP